MPNKHHKDNDRNEQTDPPPPNPPPPVEPPQSAEQIYLDPTTGHWNDPNTGLVLDTYRGSWHDPETDPLPPVPQNDVPPPPGYYYGPDWTGAQPVRLFPIPDDEAAQMRAEHPPEPPFIQAPGSPDGILTIQSSSGASSLASEPLGDDEGEYEEQEVPPLQFGQFGNTGNFNAPDPNAPPSGEGEYEEQEVPPLQFGNTSNFQNAPDPNAPLEYPSQEVPPLQFGNTGNLQPSQEFEEYLLFEEYLFNPEAPGPTLSTDLFDPTAPGPTLDTGLIPDLEHSPQVVEALNQDPDLAAALERDPGMIEHLKQDAPPSYGELRGITQGDGGFTDQGLTDPSLTEHDTPDQDVDYTL